MRVQRMVFLVLIWIVLATERRYWQEHFIGRFIFRKWIMELNVIWFDAWPQKWICCARVIHFHIFVAFCVSLSSDKKYYRNPCRNDSLHNVKGIPIFKMCSYFVWNDMSAIFDEPHMVVIVFTVNENVFRFFSAKQMALTCLGYIL